MRALLVLIAPLLALGTVLVLLYMHYGAPLQSLLGAL